MHLDIPRDHVSFFQTHMLVRTDSWFVRVFNDDEEEIGLIYLTNIIPTFTSQFNVIFWDKRFGKNRRELCQRAIATALLDFELTKVTALVPITNGPLATEVKKIGFVQEGVLRKAWRGNGEDVDLIAFGLLRNEAETWQPVQHLSVTTSSARRT